MHIPEILTEEQTDNAVTLLSNYYTQLGSKGRVRTGARFDTWAGGGDAPDVVNTITADDMLAASFLSVPFEPTAVIGILDERRVDVAALLSKIPFDLDLADLQDGDFEAVLGAGSPAWQLWDILRGNDLDEKEKWGIGPTRASKLMARKRPRLIPIWDSVVQEQTESKGSLTQWKDWYAALTKDGGVLALHLDEIQRRAELPHPVSRLRAMDVVLWMRGRQAV
ncbi:DUF6308 family protein [Arthrobacter sp. zg-Y1171]|uniref:DUF6308 family protein n=1 Tax=Arthrobacter sp. zg-Y1171 TaxID=2964610 RepID=UPI0021029FF2|nr:DUF6308 family protein [Arthrobacter sp. zg-Y1171]MCQ1994390.1 DUF6308 family protein [Arthrobacter sp. zg-Y1171]UWX81519.1 DUF6308 family protein [Arthrobacter sp. zg-Y1171]